MDIKITYNGEMGYNINLKTMYEFIIPARNITFEDFMNYKSEKVNKTNAELIYDKLSRGTFYDSFSSNVIDKYCDSVEDKGWVFKSFDKIKPYIMNGTMLCPTPCILYADSENLNEGIILQSGNLVETNQNGLNDYENDNDKIIFDKLFENLSRKTNNITNDFVKREESKPLVWIWCKSLCPNGRFIENSIFNLSPFIEGITINDTENGSSFSLDLISVEGSLNQRDDLNSIWAPNKNSYIKTDNEFIFKKIRSKDELVEKSNFGLINRSSPYRRSEESTEKINSEIRNETLILEKSENYTEEDFSSQVTKNLFQNLISSNDVVFISFNSDSSRNIEYVEDFFTNNSEIPNLEWDLIGLVDNVNIDSETELYSQSENVSGRDLMKLMIEDGSYFFMNSSGNDQPSSVFENNQLPQQGDISSVNFTSEEKEDKKSMNRIYNGMVSSLYLPTQRNIGFIMNLLLSKLCNVEICPNDLFEPYGDLRTKYNIPIITSE